MGRISHNGEQHGNGFSIEEAVIFETGKEPADYFNNPEKFAVELVLDSYIENDVPSDNKVEFFDLY